MALSLRQEYDYWQDQPDYMIGGYAIVVTHGSLIGPNGLVPQQTIQVSAP